MQGLLIIGGIVLAVAFMRSATHGMSGMNDKPVFLDSIRMGVARGWYAATLTRVDGKPAIRLFGKDANGDDYGDVFPISEHDWQTLKNEGYSVAE